jgi:uncharacterized protein (UPF0276 family)
MALVAPGAARALGAGIGLRAGHMSEVMTTRPRVGWLEVHAENHLGGGGLRALEALREDYPISIHAVGLSLGRADDLDQRHLARLRRLVERVEPAVVSEHLSWSSFDGAYLNHLLPLPYTEETLAVVSAHVDQVQGCLGRRVLLENPSSYLRFRHSPIPEPEFLGELVRRTGCGLLCDVNNAHVSGHNTGFDPAAYLEALPVGAVGEIHLAGHAVNDADGRAILIDDHGSPVAEAVWALYGRALARFGPVPTLVERDTNLPPLAELLAEAARAERALAGARTADGACPRAGSEADARIA